MTTRTKREPMHAGWQWRLDVAPLWPHHEAAARRRTAAHTAPPSPVPAVPPALAAAAPPAPAHLPLPAAPSADTAARCLAEAADALAAEDWPVAIRRARKGLRLADATYLLRAIEASGARGREGARLLVRALEVTMLGRGGAAPSAERHPAAQHASDSTAPRTILLVGGIGRMQRQYRALVEAHGYELEHVENRQDRLARLRGTPAAVLVVVTEVSHPMREHARRIAASAPTPLVYLKASSLAALRRGLDEIADPTAAAPASP